VSDYSFKGSRRGGRVINHLPLIYLPQGSMH